METHGCEACHQWMREFNNGQMVQIADCKSSFRKKHSYFSVDILKCPACGATYVSGYYENFDDTPIEDEFGKRTWITRVVSDQQIREIELAKGSETLDIDSFARNEDA